MFGFLKKYLKIRDFLFRLDKFLLENGSKKKILLLLEKQHIIHPQF